MAEAVLQMPSARAEASSTESTASTKPACEYRGLRVGDLVRSNEFHWLKTGQHLSGSIVRFETVPESQMQAAGGDQWAYLNSGEGPISTNVLEKVPAFYSQLENLHGALESLQEEFEPKKSIAGSR